MVINIVYILLKDGYRPIHFTGSPEVADTLIKAGADYTVRTSVS